MSQPLQIRTAEFAGAIARPGQDAPAKMPEVAFAGRSNVGKSSLINALLGRRKLARVSKDPGRTREINFFRINDAFHLVDLPGYGFAKAPESVRRRWRPLIESYLTTSGELRGLVILIDSRRGIGPDDRRLLEFVAVHGIPALVVLTKIDKLNRAARVRAFDAIQEELALPEDQLLATSARTREGVPELARALEHLMEAERPGSAGGK